ncbi:MAG: P1 family peptidase, partial [Hymenobacteraceae bacterium]|nr:P1 family peptidase [Hymenobacteraceae bacterium]
DYVIAFSTHPDLRIPYTSDAKTQTVTLLRNDEVAPLFLAVIEATEEAIINSLFMAETSQGKEQRTVEALPVDTVLKLMKNHNALKR